MLVGVLYALVSLYVLPDHVRAWRTGSEGEIATAQILEPLASEGFIILHDRRIPGGRENIDHTVIGRTGVFVVETKNYAGDLRVRDGELVVNGRRRTGVINQITRQQNAVSAALDSVPVLRVVVVHRADFPLLRTPVVHQVPIVKASSLAPFIRDQPTVLDLAEVDRLAGLAATRLRAAS